MKIFDEPILKQVDNLCKQAKILTNKQRLKQTLIGKLLDNETLTDMYKEEIQ